MPVSCSPKSANMRAMDQPNRTRFVAPKTLESSELQTLLASCMILARLWPSESVGSPCHSTISGGHHAQLQVFRRVAPLGRARLNRMLAALAATRFAGLAAPGGSRARSLIAVASILLGFSRFLDRHQVAMFTLASPIGPSVVLGFRVTLRPTSSAVSASAHNSGSLACA